MKYECTSYPAKKALSVSWWALTVMSYVNGGARKSFEQVFGKRINRTVSPLAANGTVRKY